MHQFRISQIAAAFLLTVGMSGAVLAAKPRIPSSAYLNAQLDNLEQVSKGAEASGRLPSECVKDILHRRDLGLSLAPWAARSAGRDDADVDAAREGVQVRFYESLLKANMLFDERPAKGDISKEAFRANCKLSLAKPEKAVRQAVLAAAKQFPDYRKGDRTTDFAALYEAALEAAMRPEVARAEEAPPKAKPVIGPFLALLRSAAMGYEPRIASPRQLGLSAYSGALSPSEWASVKLPDSCKAVLKDGASIAVATTDTLVELGVRQAAHVPGAQTFIAHQFGNLTRTAAAQAQRLTGDKAGYASFVRDCTQVQKRLDKVKSDAAYRAQLEAGALETWMTTRLNDMEPLGAKALRHTQASF